MALAGGGRCQEGDLAHEAGEGSYVTMWIFAHGAERNATVAGDGMRAVSTWVG